MEIPYADRDYSYLYQLIVDLGIERFRGYYEYDG